MIHFVNITEKEFLSSKRLYKHLPLENALKALNEKQLWFANPKEWQDPFEKRFIDAQYMRKGQRVSLKWTERIFCSCMSMTSSSEAYWRVYAQDQLCVEFRINRATLLEELKRHSDCDIYIGRVEYMLTNSITQPLKQIPFNPPCPYPTHSPLFFARLLLLKRFSFKYEDEIRIIVVTNEALKKNGIALSYGCESTTLVNQIVLDPRIGNNTALMLKHVFEDKYGFKKTPNGSPCVVKSGLYSAQNKTVLEID